MRRNAESGITSDFRFQCCIVAHHAESGISSDFRFKCYIVAPHTATEHMQWNAESGITFDFLFLILVLHCCSPCDSRAHAVEHVASPYKNQNF